MAANRVSILWAMLAAGKAVLMRSFAFDITSRKWPEERFQRMVDVAPCGMILLDGQGVIRFVNLRVEACFGYSRQELAGQPIERLIPEKLRSAHADSIDLFMDQFSGPGGGRREVVGRHKDGSEIALEVEASAIPGPKGEMLLASIIDITARKQDELAFERQRNELAHLSRVTMLGELSGSLAHELKQPLAAILSNAQAALCFLSHAEPNVDEVRAILRDIVEDDLRAGSIIQGLRLLLKKEQRQHEPLDLNKTVLDALKLVRSDMRNGDVGCATELAADLPSVVGDRVQLQQVLLNLVMNGCDAMRGEPQAGRQLLVTTERRADGLVQVCVADQGQGIPPEDMERVFEPFVTTKAAGLGLGLSVCRQIIAVHGGCLWATNNQTRGARFYFSVPVTLGAVV